MSWSVIYCSMQLLELFRTFGYCNVHIGGSIHVHEISFIRNIRRSNVWSLHWSVRRWARSLVTINNLNLLSSNLLIVMVLVTFLGSSTMLSGMLLDLFKGVL